MLPWRAKKLQHATVWVDTPCTRVISIEVRLKRSDWLLLLLGLPGDGDTPPPAMDRVRVMKCLFVLGKRFSLGDDYYHFRPYNYGPFDENVYRDAERLVDKGLIEAQDGRYVRYAATASGIAWATSIAPKLNPKFVGEVRELRTWANSVTFSELVKKIYAGWPETRVNSIFQG